MDKLMCPKCQTELIFYPDIIEDREMESGTWYCETVECENYDLEVFNSGDFEYDA